MRILLDTNVVSELVAKTPSPTVLEWIDAQDPATTCLSAITVGELQRGVSRLPPSKRRDNLEAWLRDDLLLRFHGNVLPIDEGVMLTWGSKVASLEAAGRTLPAWDSLIAAQARHFRCVLATRNTSDFEGCEMEVVNPWLTAPANDI